MFVPSLRESSLPRHTLQSSKFGELKNSLREMIVPVVNPSPLMAIMEKETMKAKLNDMLTSIASEMEKLDLTQRKTHYLLLGEVLTKLGRLHYEEDYAACMGLMRASLNVQLCAFGIFDTLCFSPDNISFSHISFATFDDFLIQSDVTALSQRFCDENLSSEELTLVGYTLSWLANSMHHTKGYRTKEENKEQEALNHKRFDQVYLLCEKILVMADCQKANLELAEMYYNGLHGVELRKDAKNIEAAFQWLDKAMKINPSPEMAARVANLKSGDWASVGNLEKARETLDEAIRIRQSFSKEQQDPFLVANLNSRKSGFCLKEGRLEEAELAVDCAIEYSTACRGSRNPQTDKLLDLTHDHQYFGIYDMKKAQIKSAKNELAEAKKYIIRAIETFSHHADSEDLIEMAKEIFGEILMKIHWNETVEADRRELARRGLALMNQDFEETVGRELKVRELMSNDWNETVEEKIKNA